MIAIRETSKPWINYQIIIKHCCKQLSIIISDEIATAIRRNIAMRVRLYPYVCLPLAHIKNDVLPKCHEKGGAVAQRVERCMDLR